MQITLKPTGHGNRYLTLGMMLLDGCQCTRYSIQWRISLPQVVPAQAGGQMLIIQIVTGDLRRFVGISGLSRMRVLKDIS